MRHIILALFALASFAHAQIIIVKAGADGKIFEPAILSLPSASTLTLPTIASGLTATGSVANDFSGSTGTFLTSTGANTLGGATTSAFTFIQTSASANAFATGLAGNTNPVFRTVNNIASQATGISITGRAAAAGADITVLSSGTDESLVINAKGAGALTLNPTATGNIVFGRAVTSAFAITQTSAAASAFSSGLAGDTNPVFRLVNNIATQATGISITGRAAAAGADITVLSSGTDENLVINAKGAGTITLNPTGTGNVVFSRAATGISFTGTGAIRTSSASVPIGYATGAGGAVTQATNRSTTVVMVPNPCTTGAITTTGDSLAGLAIVTFTVTDSAVALGDVVTLAKVSGDVDTFAWVNTVGSGSFTVTLRNSHATDADVTAFVFNFVVVKGSSN